jgi:threonine synthase
MKMRSTRDKGLVSSFEDAVLNGFAHDGGFFTPVELPRLNPDFLKTIQLSDFQGIAVALSKLLLRDEIGEDDCEAIVRQAYSFDAPLVSLEPSNSILELFHGPTLAFKDFGGRFLASVLTHFANKREREITVLVVTTGDTGCAVGHALSAAPGIRVVLLYPSGLVSPTQEQQLTTLGGNVTALEVEGTIDDCNRLAREAFSDDNLRKQKWLTPGNSSSIGRILPQIFYYFHAYAQLVKQTASESVRSEGLELIFSVPVGNSGNMTAGAFAKKLGLPMAQLIACTNINDALTEYLRTAHFQPKPTRRTLSSAMDLGRPSLERLLDLYDNNYKLVKADITGYSFTDDETSQAITQTFRDYNYVLDPHSAVAYLGARKFLSQPKLNDKTRVITLATAHPAKFPETIEPLIACPVEVPERLAVCWRKSKQRTKISNQYHDLRDILLQSKTVMNA